VDVQRRASKESLMSFIRLVVLSFAAAMISGCADGQLGPPPTPTPGPGNAFVYTANAGGNSISGFKNDSTGALTPVSGSPFSSPGQPFGIAATSDNRFLYVSSFQNAVVSVFAIDSTTGGLTPVTCTPVASTGPQPLKIAITPSGKFLYTSNQGGNVSGFSINTGTGCLTAISTTTADLVPRGLTVERTGKFLYVVTGGGGIDVFAINVDGTLTRQSLAGFDSLSGTMLAVKASPTTDVMIATDGGNANNFRTFVINTNNGIITPITTAGSSALTPSAIAYNPVANTSIPAFYIANTGSNNFTASSIASDGTTNFFAQLVPVTTGPVDLASDPAGKFVYVANNGSSNVAAFMANINGSNFNSVFIAAANTGSGPQSIAVVGHP
jgi:6-phosphogluconolactonase